MAGRAAEEEPAQEELATQAPLGHPGTPEAAAPGLAWRQARAEAPLEAERLGALVGVVALDTPAEAQFDDLVEWAARRFRVPMAAMSLIDAERRWIKAAPQLQAAADSPRNLTFCDQAIRQADGLVVTDASTDLRLLDTPMVTGAPNIRFHAKAPLERPEGPRLGALCVLDTILHESVPPADRVAPEALARDATAALLARHGD